MKSAAAALLVLLPTLAPAEEAKPDAPKSDAPMDASKAAPRHTNRLAKEKSPYLLQHAHNPVDWWPWCDEAFEKAKQENKPVLLSIGYSTCHWCHVMERESFESEKVAEVLNKHFICIKLDREERPDIDNIYMTAMQALGMGGGWPLNVFLTPDRKPFFGGTYFPPEGVRGRPGFRDLCQNMADLWKNSPQDLLKDAENIATELKKAVEAEVTEHTAIRPELVSSAAKSLTGLFDKKYGGWGSAPKFPSPPVPQLLLLNGWAQQNQEQIDQVLFTCRRMAAGGMYDQIGGGFSRYSVDSQWLVPHFEKMLYDNAQLVDLYLNAGLQSGDAQYFAVVEDIVRYLVRDMTHKDGGWYSAEDADSEGHEGKFYCWTTEELKKLLSAEEYAFAEKYYGLTAKGNFVDHSHPQPMEGQNVLSIVEPDRKLNDAEQKMLATVREKIFTERAKRVRPHLDDKILTSWNGLMLGAVARAGIIMDKPEWIAAARKNAAFVKANLWDSSTKSLFNRWRDGERDKVQLLSAYAAYLGGLVELYQVTLAPEYLTFARDIADSMIAKFDDPKAGGFYTSTATDELIFRNKDDYDGAEPSGNSQAIYALLKLAAITDHKPYRERADAALKNFSKRMQDASGAVPLMLQAAWWSLEDPYRVVVAGDVNAPEAKAVLKAAHMTWQPRKVILGTTGPVEDFAKSQQPKDGKVGYVCTGSSCRLPTSDPAEIRKHLTGK